MRVLCVCSAGLLRSPTLANVLHEEYAHNTRACGASDSFALIPLSDALVSWADEIVFVEQSVYDSLPMMDIEVIKESGALITILDIPDRFDWNNIALREECSRQYRLSLDSGDGLPV